MRLKPISYVFLALVLVWLGFLGFRSSDFPPGITPVPASVPARAVLAYLCASLCIACGVGLLIRRTATIAAGVFFGWMLLWLLALRVPWMLVEFSVGTWWAASSTALLAGTAWLLFASVLGLSNFFASDTGMRIARTIFGLGLIPIGLAHFLYLDNTAPLVPAWMQWPVFWSYFTGAAFIAAGIAMIAGVFARPASILITMQIALLTLSVWLPKVLSGQVNAFQWGEFVVSILLTVCAWVVADSYRFGTRSEEAA